MNAGSSAGENAGFFTQIVTFELFLEGVDSSSEN